MATANLVQRLRTCSAEERRNAAMELARSRTPESVRELIQMANGVKQYKPGSWRTLWRPVPCEFYGLEDQLIAVNALAETSSKTALKYLKSLLLYRMGWKGEPNPRWRDYPGDVIWTDTRLHINAMGELKEALASSVTYEQSFSAAPEPEENQYHAIIQSAIQKLECLLKKGVTNANC